MTDSRNSLFFRTEDIEPNEIHKYFVETSIDRANVNELKSQSPVLLQGSRGVGKSFLLRVAEAELLQDFNESRVLPVYVNFSRAVLLQRTQEGFIPWMASRITSAIKRAIVRQGLELPPDSTLIALTQATDRGREIALDEHIINEYERMDSRRPETPIRNTELLPDPDQLKESIEELCAELNLRRINLFVDEAAHVFQPDQQRQFFTLMRDLRSAHISVNAAVYPGITSYGPSFQLNHDARYLSMERKISSDDYVPAMRDILHKQLGNSREMEDVASRGNLFDALAFASMGNPRILLNTYSDSRPLKNPKVAETLRSYYREGLWSEHTSLGERYHGHRRLVDWGRNFIESEVLPRLSERNGDAAQTSSAIWVHRDAPQAVRQALNLLCYSGILHEDATGIRATRRELGTRYLVNIGCTVSQSSDPVDYVNKIRQSFSVKRMVEFGANHPTFSDLSRDDLLPTQGQPNEALQQRLAEPASQLDLTDFQKRKLEELNLQTIGEVLAADEESFKTLHYVGDARARRINNAAVTAVIEYLSG